MKLDVSGPEASQDGRLVEVRQVGHVLVHVELGRVHLLDVVLLDLTILSTQPRTIHKYTSDARG